MRKITFETYQQINLSGFKRINSEILRNNIKWWAHSGTLLGIVRDKKIIPWDDDIDMGMRLYDFRKNYDLLKKIAEDNNYLLFDRKDYFGLDVARFIYKEKFIVEFENKEYISAPYIDIMLGVSKNKINYLNRKFWFVINNLSFIYNSFWKPLPKFGVKNGKIFKVYGYHQILIFLLRIILLPLILILPLQNLWLKFKAKKHNDKVAFYYNYDNLGIIYDINNLQEMDFEGTEILVNKDFKKELTLRFKNYKNLPPKNLQIPHHLFLTPNLKKSKYKIYPFIIK